jgi:diamine N-acetyltransferase
MKPNIREIGMDDITTLREFSYKTYNETFKHMNTPDNMKAYLDQAFDTDKLRNELSNSNSVFYFLYIDEVLSGYLKLNECEAQSDIYDLQALEIERIYIAKEFHGRGMGNVLMNKAIDVAKSRGKKYVWLGLEKKR